MVSRMACMAHSFAESIGLPENTRQGAPRCLSLAAGPHSPHFLVPRANEHLCDASMCKSPDLQERQAAKSLFLTADNLPTQLADTLSKTISTHAAKAPVATDEPKPAAGPGKAGRLMSKEEADKVKDAIARATSIEEIRRLERSLREGFMPDMQAVGA